MFKRFLAYYRPYVFIVISDLFCAVLTTVCELVFPLIVREITGIATSGGGMLLLQTVIRLGGVYLFLRIVDTVAQFYMANIGHIMGAKLETDMRRDIFDHLQKI